MTQNRYSIRTSSEKEIKNDLGIPSLVSKLSKDYSSRFPLFSTLVCRQTHVLTRCLITITAVQHLRPGLHSDSRSRFAILEVGPPPLTGGPWAALIECLLRNKGLRPSLPHIFQWV